MCQATLAQAAAICDVPSVQALAPAGTTIKSAEPKALADEEGAVNDAANRSCKTPSAGKSKT